ncbi:hydantoinase/oxoprolinase family protein [Rhizobium leguminosarum]|uniref:hydantoinase/oxoprolinase family protein n=1 Tax=Rhizobium leguminosarum TaxID=384 RepID=UPI001C9036AE|nr:hydantoinase/oxoprolinase family protein [Rhizobium leguminosarum]MBY2915373.1 hydantoinase/oxoprolinase family protein [Rhizobium leguminosarum]MBY2970911.1 hydantoinase/oxoprolinase family protein [Rhizobium leguminosarum]MBY2977978.1 hydantoinase/oxoprolinase family protein [Rhizobium leguminosarum]MBY3006528.1 hydantoinase/oxoprolinase family protein [Rhizobium leguminosarum]
MAYRVGVDVGGSFTDFAVFNDKTGRLSTLKVFSRPDAPGEEILLALDTLKSRDGIDPAEIVYFTHGTTVGVNTVIQRNGHEIALFTTKNFEDILDVARLKIPQIHNLYSVRPAPLISRERVFGINERMHATGEVMIEPDGADVARALASAIAAGCKGIVLSFLHSYRNPCNELAVKAMIEQLAPGLPVISSAQTWPIIREFERTITSVISGYVQPRVAHYLNRFETVLRDRDVACPLLITKTNGGVMGIDQARAECVQMILSGTASGVIGAGYLAKASGFDRIMSLDIGGTSADVAVIIDGEAQYGVGELIGDFQIHVPSVSVSSVGQGGGSVAWLDSLGMLQVGPESAGSTPGPACYGRGGTKPTITDAVVASNLIGHTPLGYGAVTVDRGASREALAPIAEKLGISIEALAGTIIDISVSGMYAEVSALVSRFAIDPREFHLFAFGGAGAMLACFLAKELDMKGVVVPPTPGVVSALGGLIADLKNDFIRTIYRDVTDAQIQTLVPVLDKLEQAGNDWLKAQGYDGPGDVKLSADMRYIGQSFEVETPISGEWLRLGNASAVTSAFHVEHERLYGHADKKAAVQMINLRLVISGATPKPALVEIAVAAGSVAPKLQIDGWFSGRSVPTAIYMRQDLAYGHRLKGPAIIAQDDTTTVVPPDFDIFVDRYGNLVITKSEA